MHKDTFDDEQLLVSIATENVARVDKYLADNTDFSRSAIQRLIADSSVFINGIIPKKNTQVNVGDTVSVKLPPLKEQDAQPENIPLDILYEDDDLLVVNKPQGMVVHPAPGNESGTLVNALLYHCRSSLSGIGGTIRPGIVHRIDKNTAGLLMVAKNDFTHIGLSEQIRAHTLLRQYETVVYGLPSPENGTIHKPIGRSLKDRKKMAVFPSVSVGIRDAVTHYECKAVYSGYTHLSCRLETGRTHQIRVHLSSIGHPVVGDDVYAPGRPTLGLQGQCLVATTLGFIHPRSGEFLTFHAPLPDFFTATIQKVQKLR